MIDFTSSLYLGLRHPARSLSCWERLTAGRPAILGEVSGARAVARRLARHAGCRAGVLLPSTLHAFMDLFVLLGQARARFFVDEGTYPIARWGVERAMARHAPARLVPHHDADAMRRAVVHASMSGEVPVVVCDGFCVSCGRPAPLGEYAAIAREHDGLLVIDDTQALGMLGRRCRAATPFGAGGGGTLIHRGVRGSNIVVVASLAKAFGVPTAILAGSRSLVARFERSGDTRVHCSPPSAAAVVAAWRALRINRIAGEALRSRLWRSVRRFRTRARAAGLALPPGVFPVQGVDGYRVEVLARAQHTLERAGFRTLVERAGCRARVRLTCILTSSHGRDSIDALVRALAQALR